jgi:Flp pilus assembly protein TadG
MRLSTPSNIAILPRKRSTACRTGVAAVELAVVLPVLVLLLLGLWEVGRVIMVMEIMNNATREGARLAASGSWTASNAHPSMLAPSTNNDYEVQTKVLAYLQAAGINTTGAQVTVTNVTQNLTATYTAGTTVGSTIVTPGADPAANANATSVDLTQPNPTLPSPDQLTVTLQVPYLSINWDKSNWFGFPANLATTVRCDSLRDIPLSFSTVIPTQPIPTTVSGGTGTGP